MSDGSSYRLALENDSITVIVDDEGIAGLQWYSPTEISGTDTGKDVYKRQVILEVNESGKTSTLSSS